MLLLTVFSANAQQPQKIRLKKEQSTVYFFQKGIKSDTIIKGGSDLFYLVVPDSLKPLLSILVENGRLVATANDSLVQFEFLKGLSYEGMYVPKDHESDQPGLSAAKDKHVPRVLKSLINGTAPTGGDEKKIRIRLLNRKEDKTLIENYFYYRY